MVTFAGKWKGRLHNGEISKHEVREFIESCRSAGWDSCAVVEGREYLAVFTPAGTWFKETGRIEDVA